MENCFFPDQGKPGGNAGQQGSGSVPSAKGKKKPLSPDTGKGSFVQDQICVVLFSFQPPVHVTNRLPCLHSYLNQH